MFSSCQENEEFLTVWHALSEFEEIVFNQSGENRLQIHCLTIDLEASREAEPTPAFIDEFSSPAGGFKLKWRVDSSWCDGDLPASFLECGNGFVVKALPVERGLPLLMVR